MKILTFMFVLVFSCYVFDNKAFARPRRTISQTNSEVTPSYNKIYSHTVGVPDSSASDQERCQAEANYMAQNNITGHVWGCIGRFEGVGYGYTPNCNTCTPSSNMSLTGDASAQGKNGMWYRVRSWR
jgi:hypothetical protein